MIDLNADRLPYAALVALDALPLDGTDPTDEQDPLVWQLREVASVLAEAVAMTPPTTLRERTLAKIAVEIGGQP